jgi:hypothetical protein
MTPQPLSRDYNLGRLGQAGDEILLQANAEECDALAKLADAVEVPEFAARIVLKKLSPTRFEISYALEAGVIQACVVSLQPVAARITRDFIRELHFTPGLRRAAGEKEVIVAPGDEDVPEEIGSLHYDLAVPLIEEFLLALDPYPRAPGVEFSPPGIGDDARENPFAVLKGLKSGG